jgi:hypothetical protein
MVMIVSSHSGLSRTADALRRRFTLAQGRRADKRKREAAIRFSIARETVLLSSLRKLVSQM